MLMGLCNMPDSDQLEPLERFVVGNPDLERLEDLLSTFNLFEAIGAVRQELRHSDFLAFLLNPSSPHGLGDLFLKRVLKQSIMGLSANEGRALSPIDLDVWNLEDLVVLREWQNIDILMIDDAHRLVVAIENKIDSGEHGGQLKRYRSTVEAYYPSWSHVFLFLTPEADPPSDESYIPIGYSLIAEIVDGIAATRSSTLGEDVLSTLRHYVEMLRRHIVTESEIADLCRRIYRKHQRALDLIYEYRPDVQAEIHDLLVSMIADEERVIADHSSKSYVRFVPVSWDLPDLNQGQGWTNTGRILLFEFANRPDSLRLKLIIGPGPDVVRSQLFKLALDHRPPFRPSSRSLNKKWNTIFHRQVLGASDYEDAGKEELEKKVRKWWTTFLNSELPRLDEILEQGASIFG
jgi:hypothetical protein